MRIFFTFLFLTTISLHLSAQYEERNDGSILLVHFNYGYEVPGGDLADLFGSNSRLGVGLEWMSPKKSYIFGLDGGMMFGNILKTDVLASLRTPEGEIIGNNKVYADIILKQRGFQIHGLVGKLFSMTQQKGRRAGVRATFGMGLLQHKVRIQDDFNSEVPQIEGEYRKGYDKLTNGLSLQQFIGYQFLGSDRLINFFFGFEFTQAFTQNRRDWDFAERRKIDDPRTDLLYGIRGGWTLPFYKEKNTEAIFY